MPKADQYSKYYDIKITEKDNWIVKVEFNIKEIIDCSNKHQR
jgi:hypothetical protein